MKGEAGKQGERGLKGEAGKQGERGIQGVTGKQGIQGEKGDRGGPKVVCWNGFISLTSSGHQHICTIPYNGSKYTLSNLDLVVQGKGPVYIYIIDGISKKVISEKKYDFDGKENEVRVISSSSFENLSTEYSVLCLYMHTYKNTVNIISVEFTM